MLRLVTGKGYSGAKSLPKPWPGKIHPSRYDTQKLGICSMPKKKPQCNFHRPNIIKPFPTTHMAASSMITRASRTNHFRVAVQCTQNFRFCSSNARPQHKKLSLETAQKCFAAPGKKNPKGEDAYFILPHAIGVADGVGGWSNQGVDPSVYSNNLMAKMKQQVKGWPTWTAELSEAERERTELSQPSLEDLMVKAWTAAQGELGSATAVVGALDPPNAFLHVYNIGDSGLALYREGKLHLKTMPQQSRFNAPYQLAGLPQYSHHPTEGMSFRVQVQPRDLIITASDGFWDNVFDHEVTELLQQSSTDQLQEMVDQLGNFALKKASNSKNTTPFEISAVKAHIRGFKGGKMDDITVLLSRVSN